METLLAFLIGGLFAASTFLLLRRHFLRLLFGLILLSNAVNVLLFAVGRLTRGAPPVIPPDATVPVDPVANPLPQALILTAIVINFGVLAFMLMLIYRTEKDLGTTDVDDLQNAEYEPQAAT